MKQSFPFYFKYVNTFLNNKADKINVAYAWEEDDMNCTKSERYVWIDPSSYIHLKFFIRSETVLRDSSSTIELHKIKENKASYK